MAGRGARAPPAGARSRPRRGAPLELRVAVENRPGRSPRSRWRSAARGSTSRTCRSSRPPTSAPAWSRCGSAVAARPSARPRSSPGSATRPPMPAAFAFAPAGPLRGAVVAPPDKSISHRAALLGAFGAGRRGSPATSMHGTRRRRWRPSRRSAPPSERAREVGLAVAGRRLARATEPGGRIDVGNAGTLMRLLPGCSPARRGAASPRRGRVDPGPPGRPDRRAAARGWAPVEAAEGGSRRSRPRIPAAGDRLRAAGRQRAGEVMRSPRRPARRGPDERREPAPTRDHTERMLAGAGVDGRADGPRDVSVSRPARSAAQSLVVPGDPPRRPSSSPPPARARLARRRPGVGVNPTRIGLLGSSTGWAGSSARSRSPADARRPGSRSGPRSPRGPLRDTVVEAAEVPLAIDELPLVGAARLLRRGRDRGPRRARAARTRSPTGWPASSTVCAASAATSRRPRTASRYAAPAACGAARSTPRGDHRLAMLGAVAGLASRDGVGVVGMEAAAVSLPGLRRRTSAGCA